MNDTENHVQLLVDEEIFKDEYVGCHPCVNTSSLKIRTEDVFGKFLDAVHHDYITVTLSDDSLNLEGIIFIHHVEADHQVHHGLIVFQ